MAVNLQYVEHANPIQPETNHFKFIVIVPIIYSAISTNSFGGGEVAKLPIIGDSHWLHLFKNRTTTSFLMPRDQ
jgi:hypothetical protein